MIYSRDIAMMNPGDWMVVHNEDGEVKRSATVKLAVDGWLWQLANNKATIYPTPDAAAKAYWQAMDEINARYADAIAEEDKLPRCHYCGVAIKGTVVTGVFDEYQCEQCR